VTTPAIVFETAGKFRAWLRAHHARETALLVCIRKAGSSRTGITYAEALDEALCYGWIDGVRRRIDDESFSIRFSPRKPRSIWSRINVAHVKRLIAEGRMRKAGLAAWEAREEKRTGVYSFEQDSHEMPAGYLRSFRANAKAWKWFQAQAPWYRRTLTYWVTSAKREETRRRRLDELIAKSGAGERMR
jgi:uncharacterized protein YdeI (YjbR/CyaY-like superfamily)